MQLSETGESRVNGYLYVRGFPVGLGAHFQLEPGMELHGGYWIIPFAVFCGLGIFIGTHRGARRFLGWWRRRKGVAPVPPFIGR